ncbi:SsrA-binding protein SmpB [Candidatus Dependentiae bacterium]|nr:SsrA-binding protein SmpB [Candidatus Dependentiae bacterium]
MGIKIVAQNKKAFHDYHILDTTEAGVVLSGDEVKSLRAGHVSMSGSYATFKNGELYLTNCTISAYAQAYSKEYDPTRSRKLLLHKRELHRLFGDVSKKGVTLIPLKIYFNERGIAKVAIGVCKHKKAADKRLELRERDIARETRRELKQN